MMSLFGSPLFRSSRFYLWPIVSANVVTMAVVLGAPLSDAVLIALALCLLASFGFLLNDLVDRPVDARNKAQRLERADKETIRLAQGLAMGLLFIGLGIPYLIAPSAFYLLSLIALGLILYSYLFRKMLTLSNLSAALLGTSPLWVPLLLWQSHSSPFHWVIALSGIVFLFSREMLLDVKDIEGDLHGGRQTIPLAFGVTLAIRLAWILTMVASLLLLVAALKYSAIGNYPSQFLFMLLTVLVGIGLSRQPLLFLKSTRDRAAMSRYVHMSRIAMLALPALVIAQSIL